MDDHLIRKLYYGKPLMSDKAGCETEEYKKASKEYNELYSELEAIMPKEKLNTLDAFCNAQNAMSAEFEQIGFIKGFKIGMKLAVESLIAD